MGEAHVSSADAEPDVLVVGAGPTGLTLAAFLRRHGVRVRVVDRNLDQVHESRALAVQPRTLEVLMPLGLSEALVQRGNPAVELRLHASTRVVPVRLFDLGLDDTPFPFLLFVSQEETERVLVEHLAERGVKVERGVELVGLDMPGGGAAARPMARVRTAGGTTEEVRPRFVVGCDGAHSNVRELAGIGFAGSTYPQTFALADLEVDGLERGAAHAFLGGRGMLLFFPLGSPATWRMITVRSARGAVEQPADLTVLQRLVDQHTDGLHLRDPVWLTDFRLHLRRAERYRGGLVLLAGDAAHVHSPAGGQGMNTGIQDAVNLAWKLALVLRGAAVPELLDSYEAERAPIGDAVLRLSDRAFRVVTSRNAVLRGVRTRVVPRVVPLLVRSRLRSQGFRVISELAVGYRHSPLVVDDTRRPRRGLRAGDRLPDADIELDGGPARLLDVVEPTRYALLLCGPRESWDSGVVERLTATYPDLLRVHRMESAGQASQRLAVHGPTVVLVRPDGYVGYYARRPDLGGVWGFLQRWHPRPDGNWHRVALRQ